MNTKKLLLGTFLLISFAVVLILIFMPIFGNGKNGLEYSDDFFNSLSKGSSNYMDDMRQLSQGFVGTPFTAQIDMDIPSVAKRTEALFSQAGAQVEVAGSKLKINGDLGKVLLKSVDDADLLFNNQGEKLQAVYNFGGKEVVKTWWESLTRVDAALTKQKAFKQAKAISTVQARAIEPAYNFYGITATSVSDRAVLLTFMLVFYVIYTLWFGYGIFEMFEGFGLGMGKPLNKKEV
ncbi:MAG: hypothetical protein P8X65_08895 [Syntrophobacterales bacterium]|jgi:hypothetical protein